MDQEEKQMEETMIIRGMFSTQEKLFLVIGNVTEFLFLRIENLCK